MEERYVRYVNIFTIGIWSYACDVSKLEIRSLALENEGELIDYVFLTTFDEMYEVNMKTLSMEEKLKLLKFALQNRETIGILPPHEKTTAYVIASLEEERIINMSPIT